MEQETRLGRSFERGKLGRYVTIEMEYEDGGKFVDVLPETIAELLVAVVATGVWTPYEWVLEGMALSGEKISEEMRDLRSKRVVRALIKYSEAESPIPKRTPEEWRAFHAMHPDIAIDPKYDRKRRVH